MAALLIALASARPYAGGWNDGSRLAAVDALATRGTYVIDESPFVRPPAGASPYDPRDSDLSRTGTLDRLFIGGHFYSDKSPVPSLLLAVVAKVLRVFGIAAHATPQAFCWWLNFLGGGLCYVAAVCALFRIGQLLNLLRSTQLALVISFGVGTVALPYARHLNNHVQLLAVVAWLLAWMIQWAKSLPPHATSCHGPSPETTTPKNTALLIGIGTLAGLGYTIDLGIGPILLVTAAIWLLWRVRVLPSRRERFRALTCFGIAALPWLMLHHALNYAVAGTLGPANAVPEYLQWPGSPFDAGNMTGRWQHPDVLHLLIYALDLLGGQKGILGHNLPLYLALIAFPLVLRTQQTCRPELVWAAAFSILAFLAYSLTSNNYSGRCLSVRWFVPLLAPGYLVLALALHTRPRFISYFNPMAIASSVWALLAWNRGPWHTPPLVWYWIFGALGILAALLLVVSHSRRRGWIGRPCRVGQIVPRAAIFGAKRE